MYGVEKLGGCAAAPSIFHGLTTSLVYIAAQSIRDHIWPRAVECCQLVMTALPLYPSPPFLLSRPVTSQ
jgi:hypothetical protein